MCHTRALFAAPMRRRSSGAAPRSKGGRGASRRVYTNVRSNELYEAEPERDSRIQRADPAAEPAPEVALDELPASYDDEEIAEDLAWTAEDRVRWGHLDDEGDEDGAEAEAEDWDNGDADPWVQIEAGKAALAGRSAPTVVRRLPQAALPLAC